MYRRPLRSDEIYHSWLSKGAQKKNHKYIARINLGDTFRYFYDQAALAAYNATKAAGKTVDAAKEAAEQVADKITGRNYKDQMRALEGEKKRTKFWANEYRYNQHQNEQKRYNAPSSGLSSGYRPIERDKVRDQMRWEEENRNTIDKYRIKANKEEDAHNRAVNEQAKVRREYEKNTLAGRAEKAGRQVNRAVNNVKRSVENVVDKIDDVVPDVDKQAKKVKNFLSNIFKKFSGDEPRNSSRSYLQETIIPERIIEEKIITEDRIPEDIFEEQYITEKTVPEKRITEKKIKEKRRKGKRK